MAHNEGATALTFHDTAFDPVPQPDGSIWLTLPQIEGALGYAHAGRAVSRLFEQHAAEFTDRMTALVKLPTAGGVQEVRIFSLRGAHLLGMFARTARAAEFRRWVLDVLDHQAAPPAGPPLPPPVATATVLATFERVVAERDMLRSMLAERLLKEKPILKRVLHYYRIDGLTHGERASLMGWKSISTYTEHLKTLTSLGLADYQPNPLQQASGRKSMARTRAIAEQRSADIKARRAAGEETGPDPRGRSPEHMARMRQARQGKQTTQAASEENLVAWWQQASGMRPGSDDTVNPHAADADQVASSPGRKPPQASNREQQQ